MRGSEILFYTENRAFSMYYPYADTDFLVFIPLRDYTVAECRRAVTRPGF